MVRAAVMLLLAAFPAASAFLPLVTPGRFAPPLARNSGVSALRSPVRHARGLARGAVQLRAAGDDGLLEKIDAEAFEVLLQDSDTPVVVDFSTTWCGPCKLIEPQLKMVALDYKDKVRFVKVDTDENEQLASTLQVYALPTVAFIQDGKIKLRVEGAMMAAKLTEFVEYAFFGGEAPTGVPYS